MAMLIGLSYRRLNDMNHLQLIISSVTRSFCLRIYRMSGMPQILV